MSYVLGLMAIKYWTLFLSVLETYSGYSATAHMWHTLSNNKKLSRYIKVLLLNIYSVRHYIYIINIIISIQTDAEKSASLSDFTKGEVTYRYLVT